MEKRLVEKLSKVTEEEKRLLAGGKINIGDYSVGKEFEINAARLTGGTPYVLIRPHTRFAPFPAHTHNFVEMITVADGSLTQIVDGKKTTLTVGDIFIMNKHVSHSLERAEISDVGINVIMSDSFFDVLLPEMVGTVFEGLIKENSKKDGAPSYLHFRAGGQKQIENLLENLIFELAEYTANPDVLTRTVALLFKYLSLKSEKLLIDYKKVYTKEEIRKIEITEYIRSSYKTATLYALAEKMKLSVPYLSKAIKAYFGKSFKEILIDERMLRAERLICESDMTVGAIIRSVGYENESYFHREFRKRYKKSPLDMRRAKKIHPFDILI